MAVSLRRGHVGDFGVGRRIYWLAYHLFSFETAFVLFLYSNDIKMLLPRLPVDETVLFGALSIGVGAYVLLREGIYMRGLITVLTFVIFVGWAITTAGWTPSKVHVDRTLMYLLTFNMWSVVAGALIIANRRERMVRFLCALLCIALVLASYGLWLYLVYGDFRNLHYWGEEFSRAYLSWGYTVADGATVALAIAIFSRLFSIKQVFFVGLFAAYAFFLLVGGARGPIVGLTVAVVIAIVVRPPEIGKDRFAFSTAQVVGFLLFVTAALYITYLFQSGQATNTLTRFLKALDWLENPETVRGANRIFYWPFAYNLWLSEPIFGHGLASFSIIYAHAEIPGTHPHNLILEIAAEQGIIGLSLFLIFVWSAIRHASPKRLREDPLMLCILMVAVCGSMQFMFAKELAVAQKPVFLLGILALRPPPKSIRRQSLE